MAHDTIYPLEELRERPNFDGMKFMKLWDYGDRVRYSVQNSVDRAREGSLVDIPTDWYTKLGEPDVIYGYQLKELMSEPQLSGP